MTIRLRYIKISIMTIFLIMVSLQAYAQNMSDYTAYPPFVTSAIEPNILLVLDHSGSMQFPAYTGCDFTSYSTKRARCGTSNTITDPEYAYNSATDYYGYFEIDKYYQYSTNKFVENAACTYTSADAEYRIGDQTSCISGNLMNWASMSRIDLMRKVLIGGKSVSTQTNAHTLRAEGGWRTFSDHNLGCTITIDGGSYPNLDHNISFSNYNCGLLSVSAAGTEIWGTSDSFRYIYQSASGDFDIKLRVISPPSETAATFAKAGLMIRSSTAASSQHIKAMATYGSGLQFSYRSVDAGSTFLLGNYVSTTYPIWVRIVRSGNNFTSYYSSNGTTWTNQGTVTLAMPAAVLVGMASSSYSAATAGTADYDEFICNVCTGDTFNDGVFNTSIWTALDINTSIAGSQTEACSGGCAVGTIASANLKVDVPDAVKKGIIHNLADKDNDGNWDADAPRFGLMVYAGDSRDGEMRSGIDGSNMSSFLTALQNEPPYEGTPTGEALWEAYDYFTQINSHAYEANNAYIGGQGSTKDPLYESGSAVKCRKNFILLISDGEWNGTVDPVIPSRTSYVNDIRADLADTQNIATYTVYTFSDVAAGRNALQQTALFGEFDDYDSNTWPYNRTAYPANSKTVTMPASPCQASSTDVNCKEWDKDEDGIPENYFEASDGNSLEAELLNAIAAILKRSSSGTAVSVLATTGEGDGSVYQAYFYPYKLENLENRKWLGYMHALFVDKYGNLREDTDSNDALDMDSDLILEMDYSAELGTTINKYSDSDADGVKDSGTPTSISDLEGIKPIWNGGEILWQTDPADRTLYTSVDGYSKIDLTIANVTSLEPYLRAADSTEAENIINWVRGNDLADITDAGHTAGYRERSITIDSVTNVWKLGDIIYSTPTVVGRPMENYDLLYGDGSYAAYRYKHINRRQVVYSGSNDGMLHAFNAGCFDDVNHQYYGDVDADGDCISGSHSLGQELWGFIPRGLLPHLKWNTMPDYTHVYYVDAKPKITDVNIFTADSNHTQGWGTILIGAFRYGGKSISWTSGGANYSAAPEYFALDVTDPLTPRLLWTFSDPGMGLSLAYPAVAKVNDEWYVIFGSGPTNFDSSSNLTAFQNGYVYALRISDGTNGVIDTWTLNTNFWKISTGNATSFLSDSISVDVDIDYDVDVMYLGENYKSGTKWNGLMRRITTNKGTEGDPANWVLSSLANIDTIAGTKDVSKKITAAASAAMNNRADLYIYFGTGQFFGTDDKNQTDTGAFYAIKDPCWNGSCTTSYSSLLDVSTASVNVSGSVSGISGSCGGSTSTWSSLLTTSYSCEGWAIYFNNLGETTDYAGNTLTHTGERVLGKPLVLGGLTTWTSYIPGIDECSYEGESNVYAVYYETGTAYKNYIFKDQAEDTSPSPTVGRVKRLGAGMPSSLSAQITASGTAKGFAQQSTGSILEIESLTPFSLKSGVAGWKTEIIP